MSDRDTEIIANISREEVPDVPPPTPEELVAWMNGKDCHLSRVTSRLRSQYGDGDIFRFYQVADSLHGNFYEDEFTAEDVAQALGDVESLLDKLDPLIGA